MYDASFDQPGAELPRIDRRALWGIRLLAVAATILAATADAQMPGVPLLQDVWATPGVVGALNIAGGPGGSMYAAAGSWTPGSGRFELSGGAGFKSGGTGSRGGAYGVRVALPFGGASSSFGFAGFAGIGGGSARTTTTQVTCTPPTPGCVVPAPPTIGVATISVDSTTSTTEVPVGAAVGWRMALGGATSGRGIAVYATPSYVFFSGGSKTGGLFRAGLGADIGITPSIGATAGLELGQTRPRGLGGPSGMLYGVGFSYAFNQR